MEDKLLAALEKVSARLERQSEELETLKKNIVRRLMAVSTQQLMS